MARLGFLLTEGRFQGAGRYSCYAPRSRVTVSRVTFTGGNSKRQDSLLRVSLDDGRLRLRPHRIGFHAAPEIFLQIVTESRVERAGWDQYFSQTPQQRHLQVTREQFTRDVLA